MSKVNFQIKIEKSTKEALQALAAKQGVSLNTLVNLDLEQLTNKQDRVSRTDFPTMEIDKATEKELDQAYKEIEEGKVSKDFSDVDAFIADLESDSSS